MLQALSSVNWLAVLVATIAIYLLGGLWFAPALFGARWRAAIGFVPPEDWKPGAILYVAPLAGCIVATVVTAMLVVATDARGVSEGLRLGLLVGVGYAAAVAGVDATAPTNPRPGILALIVGAYWTLGLAMVAVILAVWR